MASDGCTQWLQLQSLLGSGAASSANSYSSGSRPRTPTAAEEYARCLRPHRRPALQPLTAMQAGQRSALPPGALRMLTAVKTDRAAGWRMAATMRRLGAPCSTMLGRGLRAATTPGAAHCR
jgi:hypothetical protein